MYKVTMYKVTYAESHNTTQITNLYRVIFDCINMIKTIKCTKSQCTKSHTQSHIANTSNLLPFYSNFFHMLSTTSNYFQFTSNLLPVTSYLLPITSNLLPVTSYLLPITSNLLSISSNFFQFTSNGPYDNTGATYATVR